MKKAFGNTIDFVAANTSIGRFGIAATRRGVIAIVPLRGGGRISTERARRLPDVARRAGKATRISVHEGGPLPPRLAEAVAALRAYAAGERRPRAMRLDLAGTSFQRAVWSRLRGIPSGTTTTYGALAADLGRPQAARAIGSAVGSNPITVLIPCHRVIGSNGALTGYAWGLPMKRALLRHEGADRSGEPRRRVASRIG